MLSNTVRPLLTRLDDRREVVVREHQRCGLTRHVGARFAHRNADVRGSQRRGVVHPVAGHRDDVTELLEGVGDPQLRLRRRAGEDELVIA